MGHPPAAPLSTEEAKARLLEAMDGCSPARWVRTHPWGGIAAGLLSGFVLGSLRKRADWLAPYIVSELAYYLEHLVEQHKK